MSGAQRFVFSRGTAARVVNVFLVFTFVTTLPVLLFVYHRTDGLLERRFQNRIDARQQSLLSGYRHGGVGRLVQAINEEIESAAFRGVILLVDGRGAKIAGNLAGWPSTMLFSTDRAEMRLYVESEPRPLLYSLRSIRLPSGYRLLVGTNIEEREAMRDAMLEALLGALAISIPLGLVIVVLVLRMANRNLATLGGIAARIDAGDLSQRLDAEGENEVFRRLATTINGMLERIEGLVNQLLLVTDALAHDLRSPLTRMRAHLEKAGGECGDEITLQTFDAISKEMDGMMRLISATLDISRTEAGVGRENFTSFDLGALLTDLCEMYHPVAELSGVPIDLHHSRGIPYFGNRELIGQAVSNLIDNALKYGGRRIELGADSSGSEFRLWVADNGPGIPENSREDAMKKYGRLEEARTLEGTGLGLSLVRAVARLHGGDLSLEDNYPGLRAVMHLPKPAEADVSAR